MSNDDQVVRPFAAWLREQRGGRAHDELSEALHDLVEAVTSTAKKGSLTLTITVEPMKGDTSVLMVRDATKVKAPEHDRTPSIVFPDSSGNLSRRDPNQPELDGLREVPPPPAADEHTATN